ncbi:unnamed protein product, partial [Brassica oleracea var. botrytis]
VSILPSSSTRVEKSAIGFLNGNRFIATTPLNHLCAMNSSLMGSFFLPVSPPIYIGPFPKGFNTLKNRSCSSTSRSESEYICLIYLFWFMISCFYLMSFTVTKVLRPEALDPEGILDGNLHEEAEDGKGNSADEKVKKSSDVVESAEV